MHQFLGQASEVDLAVEQAVTHFNEWFEELPLIHRPKVQIIQSQTIDHAPNVEDVGHWFTHVIIAFLPS